MLKKNRLSLLILLNLSFLLIWTHCGSSLKMSPDESDTVQKGGPSTGAHYDPPEGHFSSQGYRVGGSAQPLKSSLQPSPKVKSQFDFPETEPLSPEPFILYGSALPPEISTKEPAIINNINQIKECKRKQPTHYSFPHQADKTISFDSKFLLSITVEEVMVSQCIPSQEGSPIHANQVEIKLTLKYPNSQPSVETLLVPVGQTFFYDLSPKINQSTSKSVALEFEASRYFRCGSPQVLVVPQGQGSSTIRRGSTSCEWVPILAAHGVKTKMEIITDDTKYNE